MATPVTVTMYAAKDGSLYKSPALAEAHDKYEARLAHEKAIFSLIWEDASDLLGRFDPGWSDLENWDREYRVKQLCGLIATHLPAIVAAGKASSEGE